MDAETAVAAAVILLLSGVGYGAWRWMVRRLHHCEDRLDECLGAREREERGWP